MLAAALITVPPLASSHGLVNVNAVVPEDCSGDDDRCLATVENQPALHAGERISFYAYNDDNEQTHSLHVTTNASADPARENTSTERALASSGLIPPASSADAGELVIPGDAQALFIWCSLEGHEAEGEHMVLPLQAPHEQEQESELGVPSAALWIVASLLAKAALTSSRGQRKI